MVLVPRHLTLVRLLPRLPSRLVRDVLPAGLDLLGRVAGAQKSDPADDSYESHSGTGGAVGNGGTAEYGVGSDRGLC